MSIPPDHKPSAAEQPTLFDLPPDEPTTPAEPAGGGRPRIRRANRQKVGYRALALDALLLADHAACLI